MQIVPFLIAGQIIIIIIMHAMPKVSFLLDAFTAAIYLCDTHADYYVASLNILCTFNSVVSKSSLEFRIIMLHII